MLIDGYNCRRARRFWFGAFLAAGAGLADLPRQGGGPVTVPRLGQPPVIDGRLDEESWRAAARLDGFAQSYPSPGLPATLATEVEIGYDAAAIYIGVRAGDDPALVRAALHARDDLADDDVVAFYLDTFGDRSRAYALRFNALGVQQDGVFLEGAGTDLSVDLDLESAGRLTPSGFEIEVRVPLRTLRYPDRPTQTFALQVVRQSRHLSEESTWSALSANENVRFPLERKHLLSGSRELFFDDPLRGRSWIETIPALSSRVTGERRPPGDVESSAAQPGSGPGDPGDWHTGSVETDAGLGVRAGRGPNLSVELAWKPEFDEVEADAPVSTANNPFPIQLAERRPFFLEGLELWRTLIKTVDTRRIEAPEAALKGAWQGERDAVAILAARDPGSESPGIERASSDDLLLRYRRTLGGESWAGALATVRRSPERENAVAGVDGLFRLSPRTSLAAQISGSVTDGPFYDPDTDRTENRRGTGAGYGLDLDVRTGRRALRVTLRGFTPDYRSDLGYLARTDTHQLLAEGRYTPPATPGARLESWAALLTTHLRADSRGRTQYGYLWPHAELTFRDGSYLNFGPYLDYLKLVEGDYGPRRSASQPGAFFGEDERSTFYDGGAVTLGTTRKRWSGELTYDATWNTLDYDLGAGPKFPRVSPAALADPDAPLDPGTGDTRTASLTVRWQPTDRWVTSLELSDDRLTRDDNGRLAYRAVLGSARVEHHFSKAAHLRLRLDHESLADRTAGQLLFAWEPRFGTSFYAGYEEGRVHDGFNPWTGAPEPGWRTSRRSAFVKFSYALRHEAR